MKGLLVAAAAAAALLAAGCSRAERANPAISERPIRAVATIGMIADAVENVGGGRVEVAGLMGPGVDPHLYKATAGDLNTIRNADIILYNGLHLEAQMGEVFERMGGRTRTVAVAERIDRGRLLTSAEYESAHDPHVWMDVTLWMEAVEAVRDALIELDPDHGQVYADNSDRYMAALQELHAYVLERVETVPTERRVLITAHDAFNYFGRAYGFEVRGLQGISTVAETGTTDIQELAGFLVERSIPAMFVETSVPTRNLEAVQAAVRARGYQVRLGGELFSDALGDPDTEEGTYVGMIRHNVDTIVEALSRP